MAKVALGFVLAVVMALLALCGYWVVTLRQDQLKSRALVERLGQVQITFSDGSATTLQVLESLAHERAQEIAQKSQAQAQQPTSALTPAKAK